MPGPFAAYPGYSAKLTLGIKGQSGSPIQTITIPASRWFFPQRINSRAIYSSSGGLLPDILPANFQVFDLIVTGRFRSDYNPFIQLPLGLGSQAVAIFDPNSNQSDPPAEIPVLVVMLDVDAVADGQVQYIMGLRGQWQNNDNNFG